MLAANYGTNGLAAGMYFCAHGGICTCACLYENLGVC